MKNTKKYLKNQSKVVKSSFSGSNITKYSGLNTVAKYMNRQHIVKSISSSFPTERHNATKFGVNQVLMAITPAHLVTASLKQVPMFVMRASKKEA